jgi:hypothetical protein
MKIYCIEETPEERSSLDPVFGPVKRAETMKKASSIDRISVPAHVFASSPAGGVWEIQPDGTFEVPDDVGKSMTIRPGWHEGLSPFPTGDLPPAIAPLKPHRVTKARTSRS